ncbi:Z protein [Lunk virus NKS-1]|uniref:Z protein n=1 Tax=Lunk virus NKS-1 TaxID=1134579 RepID=K0IYA4_9VIRU|nr:Z protein [Lunk virus NKS-1]BAM45330.1 Z protein [Lunk virus NKS-1]
MGQVKSRKDPKQGVSEVQRCDLIPNSADIGPAYCKSCWMKADGLTLCYDHYLCRECLNLLLSVSDRCPICKHTLPTKLRVAATPSAPPPPYSL